MDKSTNLHCDSTTINNNNYSSSVKYSQDAYTHKKEEEPQNSSKYTPLTRNDFDMSVIDQWYEVRTFNSPFRRSFHCCWSYKDCLYIFGGVDIKQGKMNDFQKINLMDDHPTWKDITYKGVLKLPKLAYASYITYDNEFYIIGGENESLEQVNTIYRFNPEEETIELLSAENNDVFPCLENHSSSIRESTGEIITFGGFSKGKYTNSMYSYDIKNNKIKEIIANSNNKTNNDNTLNLPKERINHSSLIHENNLYIFGGKTKEGVYLNDLWTFDLDKLIWMQVLLTEDVPIGRSGHSMVNFNNEFYIFGGKTGNIHENNEMWKFSPLENSFELVHDNLLEQFDDNDNLHNNNHEEESSFNTKYKNRKSLMPKHSMFSSRIITSQMSMNNQNSQIAKSRIGNIGLSNEQKVEYEQYLFTACPNAALMKKSLLYTMDIDSSWKKKEYILTNKAQQKEFVSIIGQVPLPRDGHSAVLFDKHLVVFGGDRNKFPFNDLYTFIF